MSTPAIRTNIELGGEKEFRQAISEINGGLKVLSSEMKKAKVEYAENADSVDALSKKNDILNRQILSQKEKIETLRAALQDSAQRYGEADKKTSEWQVSLNNAERELIEMERQLRDNTEQLDKASGKTEQYNKTLEKTKGTGLGFGSVLDGLAGKLGITLPENITAGLDSLATFDAKTIAVAGGVSALATAIIKVTKALAKMTIEAAKYADDILTTSVITGIGTDALQEYTYAAELMDVSVETLTGSQTKLIRNMQSAQQGTEETIEAFKKLGVQYANTDGSLRNVEAVFWEAIDALGQMRNETERDAISMQLMGKSAQDLNPLITAGSEAMKSLGKEAHTAGYVLDKESLQALGDVDDAMQRLNNSIDAGKRQLAVQFAPTMTKVMEDLNDFIGKIGKSFKESGVVTSFGSILESVSGLLSPLASLIDVVLPALNVVLEPIAFLCALIADTAQFIVGLFTLDFERMGTALSLNTSKGQLSNMDKLRYRNALNTNVWDPEKQAWVGNNATGTDNWRGGMTWVGENGPEQAWLPQGTRILSAQESRVSSGDTYYITISAASVREFNDIVRIAQNQRRAARMGV